MEGTVMEHDRGSFEYFREAVYARLRRYASALDNPDDRVIAILARAELPRYVRYWVALLAEHEPTASGKCPTCSHWWHTVSAPCDTWKWARGFLTVTPARVTVPLSRTAEGAPGGANQARTVAP
jgi:hypothetical protein